MSGFSAFPTVTLSGVLAEVQLGSFTSFGMQSDHGELLIADLGESYLVSLADLATGLDAARPEIGEAVQSLRRLSKIPI